MAAEPSETFRVLVVEDSELFAQAIERELERAGMACDLAFSGAEALALAQGEPQAYQAILLDHKLPDEDGIRMIPQLCARQPKCPVLVMTAHETVPNAIEALRQGALDYLVKQTTVRPIVERLLEIRRVAEARRQGAGWELHRKDGLLGDSPGIVAVREQLERVACRRDTTVLLTGETGVGKEVAARFLHARSAAPGSPFLSVDCVAMPANLIESLLFGHEKGAFTGAHKARKGVFEEAGEGTVLLDEIGDMDLVLQGKLLRVLETRCFQRVGSVREHPVEARIVAATNGDLAELVRQGRFRHDLYQRLSVYPIHLPPLRERGQDVLRMAQHFAEFFAARMDLELESLGPEVQTALLAYDFPGNVRELKNVIERAVILSDGQRLELGHLPERMFAQRIDLVGAGGPEAGPRGAVAIDFVPGVDTMESLERKMIVRALETTGGARAEAARMLGISRFQLLRRLQKYGLAQGQALAE
jgi:DNA-binding NtrC family response regulator